MDTTSRASASDLCTFSKRLRDCADAKDLCQCRQGGSSRLRRSRANSIALIANMLQSDANNNSRSERARRNWKRSYYCCFWIGITSASGIPSRMEADNNNNNNRRARLPDVVQEVDRIEQQPAPVNHAVNGLNIRRGDLIEPVIDDYDGSIQVGRQLRQISDEIDANYAHDHRHQFRDALIHFLRVVFGAVFGINLYRNA